MSRKRRNPPPRCLPASEYQRYIRSDAWRQKRQAFLDSNLLQAWMCCQCGQPRQRGFHVHHRTYKRLGFERISVDLVLLCAPCHKAHHERVDDGASNWKSFGPIWKCASGGGRYKRSLEALKKLAEPVAERWKPHEAPRPPPEHINPLTPEELRLQGGLLTGTVRPDEVEEALRFFPPKSHRKLRRQYRKRRSDFEALWNGTLPEERAEGVIARVPGEWRGAAKTRYAMKRMEACSKA